MWRSLPTESGICDTVINALLLCGCGREVYSSTKTVRQGGLHGPGVLRRPHFKISPVDPYRPRGYRPPRPRNLAFLERAKSLNIADASQGPGAERHPGFLAFFAPR